jgi:DNA repair ATPase RecN
MAELTRLIERLEWADKVLAARAEAAEWKRHYDKATERLAAYSRDFVAEHNSLTAARAEIERLYEHLRSIRHEYETSGQLSGAMLSRTTALLGEQGK